FLGFAATLIFSIGLNAQVDANTTLLLKFENSLNGEQGEVPTSAAGHSFQTGIQGQGVLLPNTNTLTYAAANNINALEGTVELWVKPTWNGNNNLSQTFFAWGGSGGIYLGKDSANTLILRLNFFGTQPGGEKQINLANISSWQANTWHHVAFTYSNTTKQIRAYRDGQPSGQLTFTGNLPAITASSFYVGNYTSGNTGANGVMDEFRISNRVRTDEEIRNRFFSFLTVSSITIGVPTQNLFQAWKLSPTITAVTDFGTTTVPLTSVSWSSTDQTVISSDSSGRLVAVGPGTATATATINGTAASVTLNVNAPALPPRYNPISASLSTPAPGSLYEVPVVILRYLPTANGTTIDPAWAPDFFNINTQIPLVPLEQQITNFSDIMKFLSEERSRFRGYGSSAPTASLGYKVLADISIYEPMPPGKRLSTGVGDMVYHGEFFQIFERFGLQDFISSQGAKEVWIYTSVVDPSFPSYNPNIHPPENLRGGWESNMSSPVTGDISNSNRDNTDLPVYDQAYVVYGRNFTRLDDGALHIEGHQVESILSNVSQRQTGNSNFFWRNFAGHTASGWARGRCGDVHHPPNVLNDYDYGNLTPFNSDITDWRPDGIGQTIPFSAATYRDTPYSYPNNHLPSPRYESHYHLFWSQSMPGYENNIGYQTNPVAGEMNSLVFAPSICQFNGNGFVDREPVPEASAQGADLFTNMKSERQTSEFVTQNRMTNWWQFTGAWDQAIRAGVGLYELASCSYSLSSNSVTVSAAGGSGSVTVTAATGCRWFASRNGMWTSITSSDIGNGNGAVSFTVAANTGPARTTKIIVGGQPFVINQDAASMTVSGRVTNILGRGVKGAVVSMTDALNVTTTVRTDAFGRYAFQNVRSGEVYTVSVANRRYSFTPQQIFVNDNLTNIDFVGSLPARPDDDVKGEWAARFW
ncbi:MAG: LamG-like jellyroll fold domain-containing protein, partial [Pyrinomonadaceae bacterium]